MRDDTASVEGMPLQLLIAVIVTGLTLAVVMGWILSVPGPLVIKSVHADPASVALGDVPADRTASRTITIRVVAYDAKDQAVQEIIVTLGGALAQPRVARDGDDGDVDGTVTFSRVKVQLPPGVFVGEIVVTIQKAGYPTKSWSIPVVRGA